ncbi:Condensin complex subunit 3 [Golovinomyces cichoracearum]|uniref:Condensin complex subunit 3 n=1 Tax=Golovinomyces cichoracearum TaxID=62708 RepID=A0A420HGE8_9PEZI|nr:Condensin complex subunit 3 [Golovinomyces cichoracearum]
MPARISKSRSQDFRSLANKPSVQTLNSRASIGTRSSSRVIEAIEERPESELRTQVASIFSDTQRHTAGHRKLAIRLRKIQDACNHKVENEQENYHRPESFNDENFKDEFTRCVLRVMPVKKSEIVGERIIRFIGLFLKLAIEKDKELEKTQNNDSLDQMEDSPSSRLLSHLIDSILPLLTAKDKFIRYRSTQLISHIVHSLDEFDNDLFRLLRGSLLKRIYDKEQIVRVQAVLGLGRLVENDVHHEDEDSDSEDNEKDSLQKLTSVLQNDSSAEVRKSLLVNLPILSTTLPFLLERARDQDSTTRRALYSRLLPALGDFRHLSLSMREKLLRWGMRDRDENVRIATHRLFRERWIDDCVAAGVSSKNTESEANNDVKHPNFDALLELLERIDVVNSGIESGVALESMKGFWEGRPDYTDNVSFDDEFWDSLTAESVFMARTFNDYCRSKDGRKYEAMIEEKMPEVTKLAFYLQKYIEILTDKLNKGSHQQSGDKEEEEDTIEQEFIVEQLLNIALTLDYSDEVGRRKMFALLRQSLSIPNLPEEVTKLIVLALRSICAGDTAGEREFCSVVLEAVADVHDTIVDDANIENANTSFHSAKSSFSSKDISEPKNINKEEIDDQERAIREILINIKCLHIVQYMLENVGGKLQQNPDLVSMLNNLVVPAVRSHEAPVRELGLLCLGLCSLLDKSLAEENLTLFMHFFAKGHPALQVNALQTLSDIVAVHGEYLLDNNPLLLKVYLKALKSGNKNPELQAVATIALAKLILGRIISDSSPAINEILRILVVMYFDPSTAHNQSVRQTLSYFLPVYAYSRKENQDRMRIIALDALHKLFENREALDDDDEGEAEIEMVSMMTIGAHLIDWTDPRKCYVHSEKGVMSEDSSKKKTVNGDVHLEFTKDIIERLGSSISKEEKKILCALLAKLHISPGSTVSLLQETYALVSESIENKVVNDATGRNALSKIHINLGKIVNTMKLSNDNENPSSNFEVVEDGMELEQELCPETEGIDLKTANTEELDADDDEEKEDGRHD